MQKKMLVIKFVRETVINVVTKLWLLQLKDAIKPDYFLEFKLLLVNRFHI